MKCSCFSLALACTFFLAVLFSGHSPDSLSASSNNGTIALGDLTQQTFTGDLHAMVERRIIRYKDYLAYKMVVAQPRKKEDAKQQGVEQKGS